MSGLTWMDRPIESLSQADLILAVKWIIARHTTMKASKRDYLDALLNELSKSKEPAPNDGKITGTVMHGAQKGAL